MDSPTSGLTPDDDSFTHSHSSPGNISIRFIRICFVHSFHFDESEFFTTVMQQEASANATGLFQYTGPLRVEHPDDLVLEPDVPQTISLYVSTVSDHPLLFTN
jgi:hypothetical protein